MKQKVKYCCERCNYQSTLLLGRCPVCNAWNTFKLKILVLNRTILELKKTEKKIKKIPDTRFKSQTELFNYIFHNIPFVCSISKQSLNKYVGTKKYYSCFMHVLAKGMFPRMKLELNNIMLGDPTVHFLIDHGTIDQRKKYTQKMSLKGITVDFEIFYKKKEELLNKIKTNETIQR